MLDIKSSVIGAGKWGSAIADLISQQREVLLYSRSSKKSWHKNVKVTDNLHQVLDSQYLFVAIPAQQVRSFFEQVEGISEDTVIVLCSKGIDLSTGRLLSDIVGNMLSRNIICVLSGPNFSGEVKNKVLTISTISCNNLQVAKDIGQIYGTEYFRFFPNDDIISTQIFGALKNVLAIACGVVRGLEMGENAVASVLTVGIDEIVEVAKEFGAKKIEIISPAGIGDIFLSCNSSTSRNNDFGLLLAKGQDVEPGIVIEGQHSILALAKHYSDMVQRLPLLSFVHQLVTKQLVGDAKIREALLKIFD